MIGKNSEVVKGYSYRIEPKTDNYTLKVPINQPIVTTQIFDNAQAYLVSDFDSGQIILSKSLHDKIPVASLTKIMTAVTALDLAEPDELITVSKEAVEVMPTTIGVVEGQKIKLTELISAMLLTSANDAAEVVKRGIDVKYGQEMFVEAMNEKAIKLGLLNTRFTNPQGFDSYNSYSTVYDLALLMHYAMNYPLIAQTISRDYIFLPADNNHKQYDLYNWNGLLGVYPGVIGGKIGNTDEAGYTTIVLSERNGRKILAVLLGAPGVLERDLWTAELLDFGFEKAYGFSPVNVTEEQLQAKYSTWKYWN